MLKDTTIMNESLPIEHNVYSLIPFEEKINELKGECVNNGKMLELIKSLLNRTISKINDIDKFVATNLTNCTFAKLKISEKYKIICNLLLKTIPNIICDLNRIEISGSSDYSANKIFYIAILIATLSFLIDKLPNIIIQANEQYESIEEGGISKDVDELFIWLQDLNSKILTDYIDPSSILCAKIWIIRTRVRVLVNYINTLSSHDIKTPHQPNSIEKKHKYRNIFQTHI